MRSFHLLSLATVTVLIVSAAPPQQLTVQTVPCPDSLTYENTSFKEQGGDGPWVIRPATPQDPIPHVAWIKDSNEWPTMTDYVRLFETTSGTPVLIDSDEVDRSIANELTTWSTATPAGAVGPLREFEWELRFFDPFPHVAHYVYRVLVGAPFPSVTGWQRADLHVHTVETNTVFEYGMRISLTAQAATAIGLQVVGITDHGESLTDARWAELVSEAAANSNASRLLLPGIELNAAAANGGLLHLTSHDVKRVLKTPSVYQASNNGSPWSLARVLDSLVVQGAVGFAAHPADSIPIGGTLVRWSSADYTVAQQPQYANAFLGLEFYNQRITRRTTAPTQSEVNPYPTWQELPNWQRQYDAGMRVYQGLVQERLAAVSGDVATVRTLWFCGGSDAHGDFAYKRTNAYGFFQLTVNDDALGKIHTLLWLPGSLTTPEAKQAMRLGQMVVSDGPLVVPTVRLPNSTVLPVGSRVPDPSGAALVLTGSSTDEFGPFTEVFASRLTATAVDTLPLPAAGLTFEVEIPLEAVASPSTGSFVVIEGHTSLGYRSVANPLLVGPATATDAAVQPERPSFVLVPNPTRGPVLVWWGRERPALIDAFDARGSRVWWLQPTGAPFVVPTAGLPAGVYLVRAHFRTRVAAEKLTIVR